FNNPLFLQGFVPVAQSGGSYQVLTWGLNWYWNPNMKVMADYTYNLRTTGQSFGDGTFSAFGMRTQMDF
ncbi:MAG: porin, partial [Planctomycetia bacterium]